MPHQVQYCKMFILLIREYLFRVSYHYIELRLGLISVHVNTERWAEEDVRGANVQNLSANIVFSIQLENVKIQEGAGQAEEFSILTKLHLVNYQKIFLISYKGK